MLLLMMMMINIMMTSIIINILTMPTNVYSSFFFTVVPAPDHTTNRLIHQELHLLSPRQKKTTGWPSWPMGFLDKTITSVMPIGHKIHIMMIWHNDVKSRCFHIIMTQMTCRWFDTSKKTPFCVLKQWRGHESQSSLLIGTVSHQSSWSWIEVHARTFGNSTTWHPLSIKDVRSSFYLSLPLSFSFQVQARKITQDHVNA